MAVGYQESGAIQEQFAETVWGDLASSKEVQIIRLLGSRAAHREQGYTTIPRTEMASVRGFRWGCSLEENCGRPPYAMVRLGRCGIIAVIECNAGLRTPSHYIAQLEQHASGEVRVRTTPPMAEHHVGQGLLHAGGDHAYEDVPDLQLVVRDRTEGLYVADIGSTNGTEIAVAGHVGPLDGAEGDRLLRELLAGVGELVGA